MATDTIVIMLLLLAAISMVGPGARLLAFVGARLFKLASLLVRVAMVIVLLGAVEESTWTYHHFGCNLYCWESGMPNYRDLPPGAPDPMEDHHYKPGGSHLPVTDARYYTMWQWKRRMPRHCTTTRLNEHRTRTTCDNPDEQIYADN